MKIIFLVQILSMDIDFVKQTSYEHKTYKHE